MTDIVYNPTFIFDPTYYGTSKTTWVPTVTPNRMYVWVRLPKKGFMIPKIVNDLTHSEYLDNVNFVARCDYKEDYMDLIFTATKTIGKAFPLIYTDGGVQRDNNKPMVNTGEIDNMAPVQDTDPTPPVKPDEVIDGTGQVMQSATPDEVSKMEITCRHCGHQYKTNIYYDSEGKIDRKKTQARCSACKRKNTAEVLNRYGTGQVIDKLYKDPAVTKGPETPMETPQIPAVKVTVPQIPYKPVTVGETPEKSKEQLVVGQQQTEALAPLPNIDMTALFHIIHSLESDMLISSRGKGLADPEIKFLDQMANSALQQAGTNPAMAKVIPYLPIIAYALGQLVIIFGPQILEKLTKKPEPPKAEVPT